MVSRRYLALAVLIPTVIGIVFFVLATAYVVQMPATYKSTTSLVFSPKPAKSGTLPSPETVVLAANNTLSVVTAPETFTAVAAQTGIPMKELESATSATVVPGTATVTIAVELLSSRDAAEVANALGSVVTDEVQGSPAVTVQLVSSAFPTLEPSGPPRKILTAVAGATSALLGLVAFAAIVALSRLHFSGGIISILRRWLAPAQDRTTDEPAVAQFAAELDDVAVEPAPISSRTISVPPI